MIVVDICGFIGSGKTKIASDLLMHYSNNGYSVAKLFFAKALKGIIETYTGITKHKIKNPIDNFESKIKHIKHGILLEIKSIQNNFKTMKIPLSISNFQAFEKCFDETIAPLMLNCYQYKNEPSKYYENSRKLLQYFGTELIRGTIDIDFWPKIVGINLMKLEEMFVDFVVVDDRRFTNEELKHFVHEDIKIIHVKIKTPDKIRAQRLKMPIKELQKMGKHSSETSIPELDFDILFDNSSSDKNIYNEKFNELIQEIDKRGNW